MSRQWRQDGVLISRGVGGLRSGEAHGGWPASRLWGMTTLEEALSTACQLTYEAVGRLSESSGFDAVAAGMRCREAAALLEDCGAMPLDLDDDLAGAGPQALLEEAARVLDEIPADQRPVLLGSARAEITGALWGLPVRD